MKRMNWLLSCAAAILIAAPLCVGCKPGTDGGEQSAGAETAVDQGAKALDDSDWSRAFDKFSDAIAADDKNVDSYYGRAAAALEIARGHYSLAQAAATNNDVKTGEAEAKKADEYFQKAVDDCDKIVALDANFANAYFLKGVVAQYQGRWNDGIEAFTQCIKIEPERADAYHRRAEIYDHTGDYMNSSVDFKKASELGYSDGSEAEIAEAGDAADFSDLNYDAEAADEENDAPAEDAAPAENADAQE